MATSIQPPSIHVDLRCDPGVVDAADRMLGRLDSVSGEDALTGLRAVLSTLVSAVPPDGSTAVSLELWVASLQAVQLIARYRRDGVLGEPPDLHPGAIALVQRCAPRWSAERTASETVVRARLDLARPTASRRRGLGQSSLPPLGPRIPVTAPVPSRQRQCG
jgi:hypothetical protein